MLFTVTGITNKTLRGLMTGLLHRPYSMNQASYDLSRLARNGLIARVPGRNRYTLTRDGLLFAHIDTKVYDHILRTSGPPSPASATRCWPGGCANSGTPGWWSAGSCRPRRSTWNITSRRWAVRPGRCWTQ
jgi:hypothetical protein